MSWAATLGSAMEGLGDALTSAGLSGVVQGPMVTGSGRSEVITIGFQDDVAGQPAAEGVDSPEGPSRGRDRQSFVIHCAASVLRGDTDTTAAHTRAAELFDQVGAALAADKTLGGAVMLATVTDWSLWLTQTQKGALASIRFDVRCDAFTGS